MQVVGVWVRAEVSTILLTFSSWLQHGCSSSHHLCSQQEEGQMKKKVGKTYIKPANISQNSQWDFHWYVIGQNCILQQSLAPEKLGSVFI